MAALGIVGNVICIATTTAVITATQLFDEHINQVIEDGLRKNGGDFDGTIFDFGRGHKVYIEGPKSSAGKFFKSMIGQTEYSVKYYIDGIEEAKIKITDKEQLKLSLKNKDFFKLNLN